MEVSTGPFPRQCFDLMTIFSILMRFRCQLQAQLQVLCANIFAPMVSSGTTGGGRFYFMS
jgi:hypothetical protein